MHSEVGRKKREEAKAETHAMTVIAMGFPGILKRSTRPRAGRQCIWILRTIAHKIGVEHLQGGTYPVGCNRLSEWPTSVAHARPTDSGS